MRVLYFIPELIQGGAERFIVETIRRLHPTTIQASIATFRANVSHYGELLPRDVPCHALNVEGAGVKAIVRFRALLDKTRPDLVHSFMEAPNFVARVAASLSGGPPVVTQVCGNFMKPRYLAPGLGPRYAGNQWATTLLANSGVICQELTRLGRVPVDRMTLMPNFVDLDRFRPAAPQARLDAKKRFGVENHHPVFVVPAWIGLAKGHITLLYALAAARRGGALENAAVLFAGRVRDKIPGFLVPRAIERLELAGVVRLLGAVSDMPALLAAADWVLLPSWYEGGAPPMAVIEALAAGVPTIVSHGADGDDRLQRAGVGIVVPTFRVGPLAAALRRAEGIVERDREAMGQTGRRWAEVNASPDVVLGELVKVYRRTVGTPLSAFEDPASPSGV
ncbi:MAG: glycosyltransferase family 4 protein [Deltaproteobacteria bacterium]|nr:glycosyltransferase family 4 protein [Deltaproteobacteria bacterium]